jgi:hypothetical protein
MQQWQVVEAHVQELMKKVILPKEKRSVPLMERWSVDQSWT